MLSRPPADYHCVGRSVSVVDFTPSAPGPDTSEGALEPYIRALRARWKLVAAVTLVSLLAAVAWLTLRTADYEATANMLVTPIAADDPSFEGIDVLRADPNESTRTVQTAAALVDSPNAAALAAQRLGEGWDRERVQTTVEVEPQGESNILSVTAVAEGADLSARVANEFARAALDSRRAAVEQQVNAALERLQSQGENASGEVASALAERIDRLESARASGDPTLSISQAAVPPGAPMGAPSWVIVALALIGVFTIVTGAALVM